MNRRACLLLAAGAAWAASSAVRGGSYEDFFSAIGRDDPGAIAALLQRGFDPNTRDPKGQPGLFVALRGQSLKAAEVLAVHPKLEVDIENPLGETPLMMAALRGQLDWCKRLVAGGAKIDRKGWAPLHYAASGPSAEVVAWLLDQRAAVNARSPNHTTPLMMAAGYGSEASVDALLSRGADPTLRNQKQMTAADFARGVGRESLAARLDKERR
jgi:ankyrin repeat protein